VTPQRLGTLLLATALLALAGCGGGSTTIIKTTRAPAGASESPTAKVTTGPITSDVFMRDQLGNQSIKPSSFTFSANADLVAQRLRWSGWGAPTERAAGIIGERPAGQKNAIGFRGTVTVSDLQQCRGSRYYLRARVTVPAAAPFQPKAIGLTSPCD